MQFQKHLGLQRVNQSISTLILSDHPFSSSAQYENQPLLHNYGIFPDSSLCSLISFTVFFSYINLAALAVLWFFFCFLAVRLVLVLDLFIFVSWLSFCLTMFLFKVNWIQFLRRQFSQICFTSLLKRNLLSKERICSHWEQILSFQSRSFFRRGLMCRKANRKSQNLPQKKKKNDG